MRRRGLTTRSYKRAALSVRLRKETRGEGQNGSLQGGIPCKVGIQPDPHHEIAVISPSSTVMLVGLANVPEIPVPSNAMTPFTEL